MKTLHLTNAWHSSSGGVSTFYRALMDTANQLRRETVLVVPGASDALESYGSFCRIYTVKSVSSPFDRLYRWIPPHAFLGRESKLAKILRSESPDLVEFCDKYTLQYVGGMLRIGSMPGVTHRPTVIGLSCERLDENFAAYVSRSSPMLRAFCRTYMKWFYFPLADHHIAVTDHTAAELRDASRGHKVARSVWVAPMGVDASGFSPERRSPGARRELLTRFGLDDIVSLALYVGRLAPEKNLLLLTATLRQLGQTGRTDIHLLIAGDGPMREALAADGAEGCRGRVHFLGHVRDRNELANLYANCDVFLHPNPREPFGIAPLEAMASGLPLVAPRSGGVLTYASDANSWLVPADATAYAHACLDALSGDNGTRVANALRTAAEYDWPEICRGYFRLYDELHQYRESGRQPTRQASFESTPGTYWGAEVKNTNPASRFKTNSYEND